MNHTLIDVLQILHSLSSSANRRMRRRGKSITNKAKENNGNFEPHTRPLRKLSLCVFWFGPSNILWLMTNHYNSAFYCLLTRTYQHPKHLSMRFHFDIYYLRSFLFIVLPVCGWVAGPTLWHLTHRPSSFFEKERKIGKNIMEDRRTSEQSVLFVRLSLRKWFSTKHQRGHWRESKSDKGIRLIL